MLNLKTLVPVILLFGAIQCSAPNPNRQLSNANQNSTAPIDYPKLVLGTWEGRARDNGKENQLVMYITFTGDNLTVDYLAAGGGKFTVPYKFKDEKTIETNRYPENLIVDKKSNDEIKFRPEGNRLREDIDMIYVCKFTRVVK